MRSMLWISMLWISLLDPLALSLGNPCATRGTRTANR
jgi:hypothetical protein